MSAVFAKLDQPSNSDAAATDCVVAARSVASLTAESFDVILRFELEQPAHLGFGKFTRNVGVTRIAIRAADIPRPGKIAHITMCV